MARVVELASGMGQHAEHVCSAIPHVRQPTGTHGCSGRPATRPSPCAQACVYVHVMCMGVT